jgi:hypothetical protein
LHYAAWYGFPLLCLALIRAGAVINKYDHEGLCLSFVCSLEGSSVFSFLFRQLVNRSLVGMSFPASALVGMPDAIVADFCIHSRFGVSVLSRLFLKCQVRRQFMQQRSMGSCSVRLYLLRRVLM